MLSLWSLVVTLAAAAVNTEPPHHFISQGIVNSDQNKFVAASSDDAIWLGYSDAAEEGDWKWNADCPASTFTRWATAKDSGGQKKHDEPDNKKGNQGE